MSKTFAPWKYDFKLAVFLWFIGIVWILVGGYRLSQQKDMPTIISAMLSVVPLYAGLYFYEKGSSRKHGIVVERRAITAAKELKPPGWEIDDDWSIGEKGSNLDMVVRLPSGRRCGIEIKSWHNWERKSFLSRKRAASQIIGHCKYMQIEDAVVWLPAAKLARIIGERNIFVVEGNARYLLWMLEALIRFNVLIKFPSMPPDNVRAHIKSHECRWYKEFSHWKGRLTQQEINFLRPFIEEAYGNLIVDGEL